MRKAIFLDRDGTINVDKDYLHTPEELEFLPGAREALGLLKAKGFLLIVISNQSGVGRGYFPIEDVYRVNERMNQMLEEDQVAIEHFYICPHVEADHCHCRKPELGLYEAAIRDYDLDPTKCYLVGDKVSDILASEKLQAGYGLVLSGHAISKEVKSKYAGHIYQDLLEFAKSM